MKYVGILLIALLVVGCGTTTKASNTDATNKASNTDSSVEIREQDVPLRLLEQGNEKAFIALLDNDKIEIGWQDADASTWLHHAVWNGCMEVLDTLLEYGANVNAQRNDGYSPLHWAAYRGDAQAANALLDAGADVNVLGSGTTPLFWSLVRKHNDAALALLGAGADVELSGEKQPSAGDYYTNQVDDDFPSRYERYGATALAALLETEDAFDVGRPKLPPRAKVEFSFTGVTAYFGRALISVQVENVSEGGSLYGLVGEVTIAGGNDKNKPIYFGKIAPGKTATRTFVFNNIKYTDSGTELPFNITFTEVNFYNPPPITGKFNIRKPDSAFIIDNIHRLESKEIQYFLDNNFIVPNDVYRAVLLRAPELGMIRIRDFSVKKLLDKNVVDKLIHFDKLPYDIEDLLFFAKRKLITQDYLELALLEKKVEFGARHLVSLGKNQYLSRQVIEALYNDGMDFSRSQIQELTKMNLFSSPEILYTYTINDGDTPNSTGNADGMIQVLEGVDFNFVIKNASRFPIENVSIVLHKDSPYIDLFNNSMEIGYMEIDETVTLKATMGVKSLFKDDSLPLKIEVANSQFGSLLEQEVQVPVGQSVGSQVLALDKQVSATESIVVRSGATLEAPRIATLAKGAVFTASGELNGWYKISVYGRSGWIDKRQVEDFNQPVQSSFLVENLKENALPLLGGTADGSSSTPVAELAFVNARPVLEIISPVNNDSVFNATTMEILAVDRSFGVDKVDIRVNGSPLTNADARGLRNIGGGARNATVRRSIALNLKRGDNVVEVTAYNSRNVASDTQSLRLFSQGVQNPPSMYVLAVGVSEYDISDQNLQYAHSDAQKIATLFEKQKGAEIYKDVKVKTLYNKDATRASIKEGVNYFLSEARKDDVAVFYFAGHGVTDARGDYYLLGHDGDMDKPSSRGYRNSDLEEDLLNSVYAEKVLVMLDSCRSGEATGHRGTADIDAVVDQLVLASGYNVISAARGNEAAWERSSWGGGAFTHALVQAMEKGKADADEDGFISVSELNESVYRQVLELTGGEQHPTFKHMDYEPYSFYQVNH